MSDLTGNQSPAWYCLRTQLKREHVAASILKSQFGIEVCLPRLRHRKKTVRGPVMFTEALFPGYLFARFEKEKHLPAVRSATGVSGLVHFNGNYSPVADSIVEELRQLAGGEEIIDIKETYEPGDQVEVISGSLSGIRGLIRSYMPAKDRVIVLLEFLGRESEVEMKVGAILPEMRHPLVP